MENMKKSKNSIVFSLTLVMSVFLSIQVYTIIHEGAHALVAEIFGASITKFNINLLSFNPSMSYIGEVNNQMKGLISLAGPIVPLFILVPLCCFMSKARSTFIKTLGIISFLELIFSNIVNVILPILYLFNIDVGNQDIIKFIRSMGYNEIIVCFSMLLIQILLMYLFNKFYDLKEHVKNLRSINMTSGIKIKKMLSIAVVTCAVLVFSIYDNSYRTVSVFDKKMEFDLVIEKDLEKLSKDNEVVYKFKVDEPKMYSFYGQAESMNNLHIELYAENDLHGIRRKELKLLEGKGSLESQHTNWILEKGQYQIRSKSLDNKGELNIGIVIKDIPKQIVLTKNEDIYNDNFPRDETYELIYNDIIKDGSNVVLCDFSFDEESKHQLNIYNTSKTGDLEIKIVGDNSSEIVLGKKQIFTEGRGINLKEGKYSLICNSKNSDGKLYIFMK